MHIYFNQEGTITTQIPHGQIVRQGNSFDLFIAFSNDKSIYDPENKALWVSFETPDGSLIDARMVEEKPTVMQFTKLKPNENTFDFKNGNFYLVYHFNVSKTYGVTEKFGEAKILVRVADAITEEQYYNSNTDFFIERTLGYNTQAPVITQSQYDYIIDLVTRLAKLKVDITDGSSTGQELINPSLKGSVGISDAIVSYATTRVSSDSHSSFDYSKASSFYVPDITEQSYPKTAANKKYVMSYVNEILNGISTDNAVLNNPTIKGVLKGIFTLENTTPTLDNQPSTKKYVDDKFSNVKSYVDLQISETKTSFASDIQAAKSEFRDEFNKIIGGAPEAYDTLKEIADYIESDKSGASAMLASIQQNKQDISKAAGYNAITYSDWNLIVKNVYEQNSNSVSLRAIKDYIDSKTSSFSINDNGELIVTFND